MKFENLVRDKDGKFVKLDLDMTDEEAQFFISFAFNILLTQGMIKISEDATAVEILDPAFPNKDQDNAEKAPDNS